MANENETVEQVLGILNQYPKAEVCDGSGLTVLNNAVIYKRAIAAHKREIAAKDAKIDYLTGSNMELRQSLRIAHGDIVAKDAEIEKRDALIKELADGLDWYARYDEDDELIALVAKAREVCNA